MARSSISYKQTRTIVAVVALWIILEQYDRRRIDFSLPRPLHTSILTGRRWIDELLRGHPERIRRQLGVSRYTYLRLLHELQVTSNLSDSQRVTSGEQLAIFLYFIRTGASNWMLQERFQRSGSTIHMYIYKILNCIVSRNFYTQYVHLPNPPATPDEIATNPKLFPFFRHCLGAVDGVHIEAQVPEEDIPRYRNRKGFVSQNVLAACGFDMKFHYILSGWEGSAADGQVYSDSQTKGFNIPEGWFYLADAGFGSCRELLTPYRRTRYHLREFEKAKQRPKNPKELFNLRHAQARNVVERLFGVVKHQFQVLVSVPEYPPCTQARIVAGVAAVFNFTREHDPDNSILDGDGILHLAGPEDDPDAGAELQQAVGIANCRQADQRRDRIAETMWESYQVIRREREMGDH